MHPTSPPPTRAVLPLSCCSTGRAEAQPCSPAMPGAELPWSTGQRVRGQRLAGGGFPRGPGSDHRPGRRAHRCGLARERQVRRGLPDLSAADLQPHHDRSAPGPVQHGHSSRPTAVAQVLKALVAIALHLVVQALGINADVARGSNARTCTSTPARSVPSVCSRCARLRLWRKCCSPSGCHQTRNA